MTPSERITAAIREARGGTAIVAFVTAGYPKREQFREQLVQIGNAADVVEIGVPFTDPMADGMTIQRSSREALRQGFSLRWLLEELMAMQRDGQLPAAPLVLMSYLNPLLAFGFEALASASARAGVCGFIIPDLPYDEGEDLRAALAPHGLALIQMVTPVTRPERLAKLCAATQGFVYAVTMTGTTGRSASVPGEVTRYLDQVSAVSKLPVCAGFGIRSSEQVEQLKGHVAGVIVGSALVEVLENGQDPSVFLQALRSS
ncbi:MAG TPA: tryptophan synthase subunit alpha [Steroidobacteraceae bacterium]|jgi:tryptophan synthase alpha chain|nr:tryptophan synthase subunit alpha [Steroidobacteraceae bacterium]